MSLAYASVTTANVAFGYGQHADTLPPPRASRQSILRQLYRLHSGHRLLLAPQTRSRSLVKPYREPELVAEGGVMDFDRLGSADIGHLHYHSVHDV